MALTDKISKWWLVFCCIIFLIVSLSFAFGIVINTTSSVPLGVYIKEKKPISQLKHDDYILFCPDIVPLFNIAFNRGYFIPGSCPSGVAPLIKKAAALPGDKVKVTDQGVIINGIAWKNSKILHKDLDGKDLYTVLDDDFVVRQGMLLPLSNYNASSFDGRYFGLILKSDVISILKPIFIW